MQRIFWTGYFIYAAWVPRCECSVSSVNVLSFPLSFFFPWVCMRLRVDTRTRNAHPNPLNLWFKLPFTCRLFPFRHVSPLTALVRTGFFPPAPWCILSNTTPLRAPLLPPKITGQLYVHGSSSPLCLIFPDWYVNFSLCRTLISYS